jgi:hypothetical protein
VRHVADGPVTCTESTGITLRRTSEDGGGGTTDEASEPAPQTSPGRRLSGGSQRGAYRASLAQKRPRYRVTVYLRDTGEAFECVGFHVTTLSLSPGLGAVGSALMRQLPVGALVAQAIRGLLETRRAEAEAELSSPAAVPLDEEWDRNRRAFWQQRKKDIERRQGKATGQGPGRRYSAGHLEEVVEIAREARRTGESMSGAVATVFEISKSAANQIARARAQGLFDEEVQP